MNRNRLLFIGTIALAIAGFASFGIYRVLRISMGANEGTQVTAVAAANDLEVGQRLEEKDLRLVKLPSKELPDGYFANVQDVVGRGVLQPMSRNELLLTTKVAGANAGSGLPSLIPEGMRAVSVKVNDVISVAGFVTPGTRVDVLLTGTPNTNHNDGDVQTTTVLENVQVLAAGQKLQRKPDGSAENVPVITLLVSPDDAQKLTLASSEGRIQLSLRNPVDNDPKKPISVRNASLYGAPPPTVTKIIHDGNKKIAVKVPAPQPVPYLVETIRGDKRDVAKF